MNKGIITRAKENTKNNKISILCFAISFFVYSLNLYWFQFDILSSVLGMLILLYFPGYFFNQFLFPGKRDLLEVISLSLLTSISALILFTLILHPGLNQTSFFITVAIINFIGLATGLLLGEKSSLKPIKKSTVVVFFIPSILFLINLALNPFINEGDSFYFIYAIKDSLRAGYDVGPYTSRPSFVPLSVAFLLLSKVNYVFLFKFIWSIVFYGSSLYVLAFCLNNIKDKKMAYLAYFLFLSAPIITTEIDIGRPQTLVLAFTAPVLILCYQSIQKNNYKYNIAAIFYSVVLIGIHELSFILIFVSILSFLINFVKHQGGLRSIITTRNIIIAILFIVPYVKLFYLSPTSEILISSSKNFLHAIFNPEWHSWFINKYKTTDGYELGWPGIQSLYYYAYNAIQLLLLLIFLIWATVKKKNGHLIAPIVFFFSIYLIIAEVLPRLGFFFLPNRAWPHLMISAWVLIIIYLGNNFKSKKLEKVFVIISVFLIIIGIFGWYKIANDKGGFFSRDDYAIANFIRTGLPQDSIIMTTQDPSRGLIEVYGGKRMEDLKITNGSTLENDVRQCIEERNEEIAKLKATRTRIVTTVVNDEVISTKTETLGKVKEYTPNPISSQPVYVFYSFSRLKGMMGQRDWWQTVNDKDHLEFFQNYNGDIVYKDNAGILIKIL